MSLRPNAPRNQRNSPSPSRPRSGDTDFRYRDIDIRQNEIRLLRLFPGVEGSVIKCELFRNSLDNSRNYTALSYTWGIAEHTKLVKLEGFDFPVTDNLESALQRLRSRKSTVILWVDAICINQDSVKERNHQVGLMRKIYKTARRVAVWLGPEGENSMAAMDLIWTLYWNPELLGRMIEDPDLLQDFKALVLLFCRDYWDRIWVVQEVINAKKIAVYCGKDAIQWDMLVAVSALFQSQRKKITSAFYAYSWKKLSWGGTLQYGGPGKLEDRRFSDSASALLETLIFHREKLCAKPEDKVYGILGVLSTHERKQFQVDYKLSPREVFLNVTRYLIENTQRLDFLGSAVPQEPNIHRVPSWVPDWEYRAEVSPLTLSNRYRPKFAAAGTTKAKASISEDGEVLNLEGVYIDSIKNLGIPLPSTTSEPAEVLTFLEWYSILVRYQEDIMPEDHEDFCRAIWLDSNKEGWTPIDRMEWTYRTFASLSREFSGQTLDDRMTFYADSFREHMRAQRTEIFQSYIPGAIRGRRYMISQTGLQGIAPADCDFEDIICVPLGSATPMVLRKEDESQHYTFIGECYINSYMYGKAITEVNTGVRRLETFEIR